MFIVGKVAFSSYAARMADVRGLWSRGVWALQCRLNRPLPFLSTNAEAVRFVARGRSIDLIRDIPAPPTSLCVGLTTYARAESCARLLRSLHDSVAAAGLLEAVFVVVVRDRSDHDYRVALDVLETSFSGRFAYYEGENWLGKPGRYLTYQAIFDAVRAVQPQTTIFLEDDVEFKRTFVEQSLDLFERIKDPMKAVLYLAAFDDDEPDGRWVNFARRPVDGLPVRQTQWFDLHAFIAGSRFFESLNWQVFAPHVWRWIDDPRRSSGVSEQFTRRLQGRGNVYQVKETLAYHGEAPSVLNVEARQERALNNFPSGEGSA